MRVLHVDSARDWRGGQNQVALTAQAMARRGHEVVLAAHADGVLAERAGTAGLDVRGLPFGGDLAPAAALALRKLAAEFRPDIVHLHDPHATSAALWLRGTARQVASRRVDFALRGRWSRWKYRRCARVIAVSRAVAEVLVRDGLEKARLRVVYEGVPDRAPVPGGPQALRALGIPTGAPVVGNVAALTAHKDQATLLEAVPRVRAAVPGVRVLIAGRGELEGELRAQARALGVEEVVVFAGFRDDLDRLIPALDVFCLSSRMEGLGTSLLDAMCYGRAVVATGAGGIPEAVEDGVTGRVVPPGDPLALAAALVEVLQSPGRRAALGAAGRRRFLERFTADRMVDETLAVYVEVM